jgi:ectoine hydroxylase-related dioxygenase (phytanoyl-CoA dioxygenase family)
MATVFRVPRLSSDRLERFRRLDPTLRMAPAPSLNSYLGMTNGFEIVANVLDQSEAASVAIELQHSTLERSRAGARHLMHVPVVQRIAHDSRLVAIAARFVGPASVPFRATLFDKSPANNWLVVWHQDTALPVRERRDMPGWGPWSIKAGITYAHAPATALARVVALRLHIDDSDRDNGPLRVLPGTHTMGVLSDTEIGQLAREIPPVDCVVPAGGVLAMRPLLVHASSKAESSRQRRVLHIEYADSLRMSDDLELAVA